MGSSLANRLTVSNRLQSVNVGDLMVTTFFARRGAGADRAQPSRGTDRHSAELRGLRADVHADFRFIMRLHIAQFDALDLSDAASAVAVSAVRLGRADPRPRYGYGHHHHNRHDC
jgi:hypothetical protein